jgi:hypothetical protein
MPPSAPLTRGATIQQSGLRNVFPGQIVLQDMTTLDQIHAEIEGATERRTEVWRLLSNGHDPALADELHELEERIARLWDEHRTLKARARFGDRDEIIKRARHEERLARAA